MFNLPNAESTMSFFSSFPDSRAKLRPVWQEPLRDTQQSVLSAVSLEEATGSKVRQAGWGQYLCDSGLLRELPK